MGIEGYGLWISQDGQEGLGPEFGPHREEKLGNPGDHTGVSEYIPAFSRRLKYINGTETQEGRDNYVLLTTSTGGTTFYEPGKASGCRIQRIYAADELKPVLPNEAGQLEPYFNRIGSGPIGLPPNSHYGGVFDPRTMNGVHPERIVIPFMRLVDQTTVQTGKYLKFTVSGTIPWGWAEETVEGIWEPVPFRLAVGALDTYTNSWYGVAYEFEVWWEGKEQGEPLNGATIDEGGQRYATYDFALDIKYCDTTIAIWHSVNKDFAVAYDHPEWSFWNGLPWANESYLVQKHGQSRIGHGGWDLNVSNTRLEEWV